MGHIRIGSYPILNEKNQWIDDGFYVKTRKDNPSSRWGKKLTATEVQDRLSQQLSKYERRYERLNEHRRKHVTRQIQRMESLLQTTV
jgi:hypothetical protein